jgi:hypothetical protein
VFAPTPIVELDCGSAAVTDIAWSPLASHDKIACAMFDGTFAIYDLRAVAPTSSGGDWQSLRPRPFYNQLAPMLRFKPSDVCIRAIAWCPDDPELIAVTGHDDNLQVWDLETKTLTLTPTLTPTLTLTLILTLTCRCGTLRLRAAWKTCSRCRTRTCGRPLRHGTVHVSTEIYTRGCPIGSHAFAPLEALPCM